MLKSFKTRYTEKKSRVIQGSILGLSLITSSACSATLQNFYVSPTGNDSNAGTLSAPFKTIGKARDAVRDINDDMTGDIFVYFRGGNYPITDTITLTSADSGTNGHRIYYKAYNDEVPVLNGATQVTGWTQHDGNIYKATFDSDEKLRTLIVNDERAYMASTSARPNGDWGTYSITAGQADWAWISGTEADGVTYNLSDLPILTNVTDIEIMNQTTWNTNFVTVREATIEDGERVLKFSQPYAAIAQNQNWGGWSNGGTHTLSNAYEFLDEANEFYFDRSENTLYYYNNGTDLASAEVYAPTIGILLNLTGTSPTERIHNVTFDGITFANTEAVLPEVAGSAGKTTVQAATYKLAYADGNWHNDKYTSYDVMPGAINVNHAESISFENGAIKHVGNEGINFTNDVIDSQIVGNAITDTGGSGINIAHPQHVYIGDGGDNEKYSTDKEGVVKDILIKNNVIYASTTLYWGHAAITGFFTDGLSIEHNHIQNTKYSGVSLGWGWNNFTAEQIGEENATTVSRNNKFSFNHVYNVMTQLKDGGAFYTLGTQPDSEANNNYVKAPTTHFQGVYHPDEGTAYYTGNNLVFEIVPGQDNFELNAWRDKRDNHYDNIFSTSSASRTGAPNSTITNLTLVPDANWPQEALDIIDGSGLEDEYLSLLDGIPDAPDVPGLIDTAGYTVLEAETGELFGDGRTFTDTGASGGVAIENIHTDGSGVSFTNMPKTTSFFVTYASKNTGSYSVYVDDVDTANFEFEATGGWSGTYTNTESVSVNIPQGSTLTLKKDSDDSGINIDFLSLINQGLVQQAEDGLIVGSPKVSSEHAGFKGDGFVGDIFNIGDYVQVTVNVQEGGQYILASRYAMGEFGPAGDRSLSVYVNNSDQVQSIFTTTDEWTNWDDSYVTITLLPGSNDIKFQVDADDTGVINLDQFTLTKIYEAEDATLTGAVADNSHEGFSGFGFVGEMDSIGDAVEFTVTVAAAGEYTLNMRYAMGPDGPSGDRSLSVNVNDIDVLQSSFTSTGEWDSWSNQTETITLQSGTNTIKYQLDPDDTGWVNLDFILLHESESSDGGNGGDGGDDGGNNNTDGIYEAEDASFSGNRIGTNNNHEGFSGTGFVDDIITEGDNIAFTVNVDTAGQYTLYSRYAMGTFGPEGNRSLSVYVNGVDQVQNSFSTTVEWDNWTTTSTSINLQAGTNTITYQFDEDDLGWINLDYIQLEFNAPVAVFGDFDGDQDVDSDDVSAFYQHIRAQTLTDSSYDFTNDGQVSSRDVRGFMSLCTRAACATE